MGRYALHEELQDGCGSPVCRACGYHLGFQLARVAGSAEASSLIRGLFALLGAFVAGVHGSLHLAIENAMLRQQVINLRRAVKRPRLTPAERLLLVISSCFTRRWRRGPSHCSAGHASSMASRPVSPSLAISLPAQQEAAATPRRRTDRADSAYGVKQPYLGLRANSRGTPQARVPSRQTNDPEVRSGHQARWWSRADMADLSSESSRSDLGLRLPAAV